LARPRDRQNPTLPVQSQTELQELARRTQRRSLENTTALFATIAGNVRSSLSSVGPGGLTGVVWDKGRIVTGPLPGGQTPTVATTMAETSAPISVWSRRVPVTVLAAEPGLDGSTVAPRNATLPQAGDSIVAVWLVNKSAVFAPGSFLHFTQTACGPAAVKELVSTLPLSEGMIGGGVFDLDSALLAVILPCDSRIVAIDVASIEPMIVRASSIQEGVLVRHGLLIDPLTEVDRRYFQDRNGLLVREVWETREETAAVRVGDLVVSLNGNAVASLDDLRSLATAPAGPFELGVQRGADTRTVVVDAGPTPGAAAAEDTGVGLEFVAASRGFQIDTVLPNGRMARAGVQAGDRVLRLNGVEPKTVQRAERAIASAQGPMLLEVERGRRRIAIVVP
jgi:hypothetical protein